MQLSDLCGSLNGAFSNDTHPCLLFPLLWPTERSVACSTHKRNVLYPQLLPQHSSASRSHTTNPSFPASLLSTPSGMAASAVYATHVSAGGYSHAHGHDSTLPPLTPVSATLVDAPRYIERPSVELKISSSGANIVNAVVVDAAGRSLYSTLSDSKRTKLVSHGDNAEVATVEWDRSSPRMVFRGKKVKCKEWLPLAGPDTESRLLVHGDARFTWTQRSSRGFLIPANRPGLAVAKWRTKSRTDELRLKIFQEALVEPGLLEAIVLSIILLQSGHSFGDRLQTITSMSPKYYSASGLLHSHSLA